MTCQHTDCHGLMYTVDRVLDCQWPVVVDKCYLCGRERERNHVPVVKELAPQGRPKTYLGWRSPAKTHDMEA